MKNSLIKIFLVLFILLSGIGGVNVYADETDTGTTTEKTDYEKCIEDKDKNACRAISNNISTSIKNLEDQIAAAEQDQEAAFALAAEYAAQADDLQAEVDSLKIQVEDLKNKITNLEEQIAANEEKVAALNNRVKNRMVESQKTMHFNGYLEFILGSKSFSDMLQRIYGVTAITSKDRQDRDEYMGIIEQLSADKAELEVAKADLDVAYEEIVAKQAELIVMQEYYEDQAANIQMTLDALTEERDQYYESFSNLRDVLKSIGVVSNAGFVTPVPGSWIVETVWNYSPDFQNGKWHLGVDYAASRGTPIHAPAGGIVIRADDSCADPGYLGSYCGAWISGGGNQVYLVCEVDGKIYGLIFFHLNSVSVSYGEFVMQDEIIGYVGSSGSSTGPHCHIEMYYLGSGTLSDALLQSWNVTFSVGRGATAYGNRCYYDDGTYRQGAPCILNPEWYLPQG
ncbi:MAG: peptidoglycan DD-metalloendopeptidase family protein [Erysipelotrichaceae bacterium]|nr:peptidoglycan DD-metalloendopeptidase family protein [Erysipelotrichaceae bacterium]